MNKVKRFDFLRLVLSICIALFISFLLIFCVSEEPVNAIFTLVTGPFRSLRTLSNVAEAMIPLMFTGTGVCIMFAANQINLAGEGAFHLGGLAAAAAALCLGLPAGVAPVTALLLAGLAGAAVTAIPALMKIGTGAPELVSSLMLNYVALWLASFVLMHFLLDPATGTASFPIPAEASLPALFAGTRLHIGFFLALLTAFGGYVFLYRTKLGYELRVTGDSEEFARYSGIRVVRVILISQLVGGFLAGLGGGVELLGPVYSRFTWTSLLGYGWDAVILCTLVKKNPLYIPLAALFLAYLRTGAAIMSRTTDVTLEIVQITQGIIILLCVAEHFLSKYRHALIAKEAQSKLAGKEVV